jgi:hypothetical protein
MEWLKDHAELVSAMATVLMTIAWVTYAQFGIITYIRQRKPRIVIDQTADHSLNTRFVIVNLSELPVYISGIMICVRRGGQETFHKISRFQRTSTGDEEDAEEESPEDIESRLRHGTLAVGQLFLIGSSKETLSWLLEDGADDEDQPIDSRLRNTLAEVDEFEFRVVAMVGTEDKPVASSRQFQIEYEEDEIRVIPKDAATRHYSSWWHRKTADEWTEHLHQMHV